jgi:release factor glutamine methyltransferase
MNLRQALTFAAGELAASPDLRDFARRDAELLLLHVLGIPRASLLANPERVLTGQELAGYRAAIARRLKCEPIQYITGEQEFFGLRLKVTPATLIPRPETEHLVEAVLDRLPRDRPVRILDVGTGTGAIALALATHLPQAEITAVDLSPEALIVARENAVLHHLDHRVRLLRSDLLASLAPPEQVAAFDAIVSNPPYVAETDRDQLHPQVRDYEPGQALFAGASGLDIYRQLVPQARAALKSGGLLALEIGHGQKEPLSTLLAGWSDVAFIADLQGLPRVAVARSL